MRPRPWRAMNPPKRAVLVRPCSPRPMPDMAAPSHSPAVPVPKPYSSVCAEQQREGDQVAHVLLPAQHQRAAGEQRGDVERALQGDQARSGLHRHAEAAHREDQSEHGEVGHRHLRDEVDGHGAAHVGVGSQQARAGRGCDRAATGRRPCPATPSSVSTLRPSSCAASSTQAASWNTGANPSAAMIVAATAGPRKNMPSVVAARFQPARDAESRGSSARNSVWTGIVRKGRARPSSAAATIACTGVCSRGSSRYSRRAREGAAQEQRPAAVAIDPGAHRQGQHQDAGVAQAARRCPPARIARPATRRRAASPRATGR